MTHQKPIFSLIIIGMFLNSWASVTFATKTQSVLPVPPYQVEYRLSRDHMIFARVEVSLSYPTPTTYEYKAVTTPIGLIAAFRDDVLTELSKGKIVNGNFQPEDYLYQRKSSDKNKRVTVTFDWEKGRARNHAQGTKWYVKTATGTQDKASKQLIMMQHLAQQKKHIEVDVADGGKVKHYAYTQDGSESIEVKDVVYDTIRIKRSKNHQKSRATLWVDPALAYLPIKVHKQEKDGNYYLNLHRIHISPLSDLNTSAEKP